MKTITILALIAMGIFAVGCDEQQSAPQSNAPAAEIKDEELPSQADFDDEAEKQITETNYKAEIDSLEKEINAQ